jgi:hypothetical protein
MLRRSLAWLAATKGENFAQGSERRYAADPYKATLNYDELADKMGLPTEYVRSLVTPRYSKKKYPSAVRRNTRPGELGATWERMFPGYVEPKSVRSMRALKVSDVSTQ